MTKAKKARKLGPKRALKTAEQILICYLANNQGLLSGHRQIYAAIEVLGILAGDAQSYDWKGSGNEVMQ